MKLAIIADLHIDRNARRLKPGDTYSELLSQVVQEARADALLIAGDVMNDYLGVDNFIKKVTDNLDIPVWFVPGNHDLWQMDEENKTSAFTILDYFKKQPYNLVGNPQLLGDEYALVGNGGWYDYGYGDSNQYSEEDFEKKQYRFANWNDVNYINFEGVSDKEVSQMMLDELIADLEKVKDKKIILMTHIATHKGFVVPLPNKLYDYVNAFLGATSYEHLYKDYNVVYNIMAHVHLRHTLHEEGTTHIMASLGNSRQWINKENPYMEIKNTLYTLDI